MNPWAVDVAGGVEVEGRPGVKDHDLMRSFIEAAHLAEDRDESERTTSKREAPEIEVTGVGVPPPRDHAEGTRRA